MTVLSKDPRAIHDAYKEAVVDSLLNDLSARLAGRKEFYKIIYGNKPSAVLMSEFILPVPDVERVSDEESNPIKISAHGLDFQISKAGAGTPLTVQCAGTFYVRIIPTEDEIRPGGVLEPRFPLDPETKKELKSRVREALRALREELGMTKKGAGKHDEWPRRSEEVRRKVHEGMGIPFDNGLDRERIDPEGEIADAQDDGEQEPTPGEEAGEPIPEIEVQAKDVLPDAVALPVPPPQKWLRLDITLPGFTLKAESAASEAAAATTQLNEAIRAQLAQWAASSDEPHGGKLWGFRHGCRIRPSDTKDWKKFLAAVRASKAEVVVPDIDLRWAVQVAEDPLDSTRLTIHLALENWSSNVTAVNRKEIEPAMFQVAVSVDVPTDIHRLLLLDRVKPSYRYNKYLKYPALGFNGGVVMTETGGIRRLATTWSPRYVLPRIIPSDYPIERRIAELAKDDSLGGLDPLLTVYDEWLAKVATYPVADGLEGPNAKEKAAKEAECLAVDIQAWTSELNAIRCGLEILKKSRAHWSGPGPQKSALGIPFEAWGCMNAAVAQIAKDKGYEEWRLFQLAFILASIPAFATRIKAFHDFYTPEVAKYANAVTLLYFATGGGKSEAFLGLLIFVLFLDRLRGKHHGVTALMRYPLRLLTLQQARRTLASMAAAEQIRYQRKHAGEPFSLGFWVGGSNTPNWHSEEGYTIVPLESTIAPDQEDQLKDNAQYKNLKERWLKLDKCPFCKGSLALRRASGVGGDALGHYCMSSKEKCSWNHRFATPKPLPFYVVDEDIYAVAPSVLLGTVDKLSALGQSQGTIRKFFGMFGFAPLIEKGSERLVVPQKRNDWEGEPGTNTRALWPTFDGGEKRFFDPFPSLLIQDEAHLLDESLGTFSGLFESALEAAFDELAPLVVDEISCEPESTTRRKIKVIAASATVNEPQRQMRNLYQRGHTVQFPHPGPDLYQSFYAAPKQPDDTPDDVERVKLPVSDVELRSHWGRVYASVLTNGHRHTVAMASVLGHYHLTVTGLYKRLRSGVAADQEEARQELIRWVSEGPLRAQHTRLLSSADFATLLTLVNLHRISLTYVTNKKGGDQVIDTEKVQFERLHRAAGYGGQALGSELISGAVSAAEIQDIVRRAEKKVHVQEPFPDLNDTLRSVIATSAISHGVDVEEFNAMFFAGMPSDIAEYIQASSRVGRTHVGFSLLVPVPQRHRDRFILEVHDIFHRFLERMILPAAVDRWAEKAVVRVMPSFFQEFVCGVSAIEQLCTAADADKSSVNVYAQASDARDFLNNAANRQKTEQFMASALGLNVSPAPEGTNYYRALLRKQIGLYQQDLEMPRYVTGTRLNKFFEVRNSSLRPMTSLRDVDQAGVIYESGIDCASKTAPEGATARVMLFIRRGSGADIDDTNPKVEAKEKGAKHG